MLNKVLKFIQDRQLLTGARHIVAAVSGGADSVAMLYILRDVCKEKNISLSVCHVEHGIRGDESKADARFVEKLAEKLGVPCKVICADIPKICADTKESVESAARRVRYEILQKEAAGALIATAHTASDNAETVIFNIARGSGIRGVGGIPAKRENIIRPLLCVSRAEVEEYLKELGAEFVTDSTNLSDDYTRNNIRHNIIPILKEINPALEEGILALSNQAREDDGFLRDLAEEYLKSGEIPEARPILSRYIMLRAKDELGISLPRLSVESVEKIVASGGGKVSLPHDCYAEFCRGKLMFYKGESVPFSVDFKIGEVITPYGKYQSEIVSKEEFKKKAKINKLLLNSSLDYDKIKKNLVLRSRCDGDKFRISGRGLTKSLRKLFGEKKIPVHLRNEFALLVCGGEIYWSELFGVAQCCAVTDSTNRVLIIQKRSCEL